MKVFLAVLLLAGCASSDPVTERCESEADRDPTVQMLRMKGAGAEMFAQEHMEDLRIARNDALQACRAGTGLAPRGGVERQRR